MKRLTAIIALISIISVSIVPSGADPQSTGGVREGEPLHLWFKRSPTQNLTTLSFYEQEISKDIREDPRYRHMIGPGGSMVVYFPTHPDSNFLQFEYNETLRGNYTFTLLPMVSTNPGSTEFSLKVIIDFDTQRDGKYDKQISFKITGMADSNRREYTGNITVDPELIQKFDGKKGGRIRITIQREDDLDTNVLLYCGYLGDISYLNLPFSKYVYIPPERNDDENTKYLFLSVISVAFIVIIVILVVYMKREQEKNKKRKEAEKVSLRRGSRRRKR
jgi:hypothetical protein